MNCSDKVQSTTESPTNRKTRNKEAGTPITRSGLTISARHKPRLVNALSTRDEGSGNTAE